MILTYLINYSDVIEYKYDIKQVLFTTLLLFSSWNLVIGTMTKNQYYMSILTSIIVSIVMLPIEWNRILTK